MRYRRVIQLLVLPGTTIFCSDDLTGVVRPDVWGGAHIGVTISATGATVEHDCASGTVDEPLTTDRHGHFDARGVHMPGHGGPVRVGEQPERHPARYTGTVDGESMTLTILLTDTGRSLGPFSLRRGAVPRIYRCL